MTSPHHVSQPHRIIEGTRHARDLLGPAKTHLPRVQWTHRSTSSMVNLTRSVTLTNDSKGVCQYTRAVASMVGSVGGP